MAERIPQSVTIRVPLQAYLASDHVTPATGKTIAVTISKNGAAYGNPSGGATNATQIGNGSYYVDLTTTDTGTLGPLIVMGTEGTIDNIYAYYNVVKATNAGFTGVPDAVANANGGLPILSGSGATLGYTVTTVTTTTNLTNAATAGDLTATMKTSVTTAATAATPAAASVTSAITLPSIPANWITAAGINAAALNGKGDWNTTTPPTAASIAAATRDVNNTSPAASSLGAAVNSAASAGDPLTSAVPGSYAPGTAGFIIGNNLNATVSSRSTFAGGAVASVTAPVTVGANNDKTGYSLNFNQVGFSPRALDAISDNALTLGDILIAAACGAVGKESVVGLSYVIKTPSTGTAIRTFTLDSNTAPTSRV